MSLAREQERQVEVWALMRPYASPDFEQTAWLAWRRELDALKAEYRDTKALDPGGYKLLITKQRARYRLQPGQKRRLRDRDAREVRRMYEAGAPIKAIRKAFGITAANVGKILSGALHPDAGGYTHPIGTTGAGKPARPARGLANGRAVVTKEMVLRIEASPKVSHAALGRELGVSHETVRRVRLGITWIQNRETTASDER